MQETVFIRPAEDRSRARNHRMLSWRLPSSAWQKAEADSKIQSAQPGSVLPAAG